MQALRQPSPSRGEGTAISAALIRKGRGHSNERRAAARYKSGLGAAMLGPVTFIIQQ